MKKIIYNGNIVLDGQTQYDQGYIVIIDDKIAAIGKEDGYKQYADGDGELIDAHGLYVLPGFIDIHMHGAKGKDLIEGTKEAVATVAKNIVKDGCTSFMASLTVVDHTRMLAILDRYAKIEPIENGANLLGVHAEGPYISKEYKALMDERYIKDPSIAEFSEMLEHAKGRLKIMTVAPELRDMAKFIAYAVSKDVVIMLGHSNATAKEVSNAVKAGASGFTHLYNAMSQHLHRDPGCVTGAMIETDTFAELICDGFHVNEEVVLATYKQFGAKRIVMITDAMLGKDMPDGEYIFSGLRCEKAGKHVRVKATGRIAGSAYGMSDMVKSMMNICHCSIKEIVQMACINPSIVAKVDNHKGSLAPGKDADIILMDHEADIKRTFVRGKLAYTKQ